MEQPIDALTMPGAAPSALMMEHAAVEAGHIAFERLGSLGVVRLTRASALNAVTHDMVLALDVTLDHWAADDAVGAVCILGEGRAFSAGGDIRAIYERGMVGEPFDQFFADEYALNIRIKRYPKPYVALIDGVAMGGGVGVSYHGSHVVVSENARFAMPECGIGFFPDVGATFMLGHMPSGTGSLLGLTGRRLGGPDQIAVDLANAHVASERFGALIEDLASGRSPDDAIAAHSSEMVGEIDAVVARAAGAFAHSSARQIESTLRAETNAEDEEDTDADRQAYAEALAALEGKSPTSMAVAARQIALGADLSFEQCMGVEARIVHRMLRGREFYEGIRAAVIDKDGAPRWSPATLEEVEAAGIDRYFAPVESGPLAALSALVD